MPRIPDQRENQRRFAELDAPTRRGIIRAVNRGNAAEPRRHAMIAIGVARRQKRFWRRAWLVAPAIGVIQAFMIEPLVALVNTIVSSLMLGGMAWWFWSRADRAEHTNLAAVGARVSDTDTAPARRRWRPPFRRDTAPARTAATTDHASDTGHVPGRPPASGDGGGGRDDAAVARTPGRAPYRPRGRKRRR